MPEEMVVEQSVDSSPSAESNSESTTEPEPAKGGSEQKDDSKAFSIRLSQEKQKIEDQFSPYKAAVERQAQLAGLPVEEYLEISAKQAEEKALKAEAEAAGKPVDQLKAEKGQTAAEKELEEYKRREAMNADEKKLIADEKIGPFVESNIEQIRKIAEETGTDLQVGLALVAAEKLPELLAAADPKKHVEEYLEGRRAGTVEPIEVGGPDVPAGKQLKTFGDALSSARERLKKGS